MMPFTSHKIQACLLILPQVLLTLIFFIWPALWAVIESFFFSDAFGIQRRFAGFENFIALLYHPDYIHALGVTMGLALSITLLTMGFGLSIAMLVNGRSKSQFIYKSLLLWPYAVAPAVAAILWRFLFHPTVGWLTHLLGLLGIEFNATLHPFQALFVIIVAASWQQFSYNFLFLFAAIKMIPRHLIEAAMLDGASPWQRFWHIQRPLLSPTLFFLMTMNMMYAFFDTFGIIDVMTKGGPLQSTTTLIYKVYQDGFVSMDPGSSSAQSVILMLIVIGLTVLQFRFLDKKVHYT